MEGSANRIANAALGTLEDHLAYWLYVFPIMDQKANSSALLVFPGAIHNELHVSWSNFQYVVDDYGDIFFEIFDSENILEDPGANSHVNALFGIDIQTYEEKRMASGDNITRSAITDDVSLYDSYYDVYDED